MLAVIHIFQPDTPALSKQTAFMHEIEEESEFTVAACQRLTRGSSCHVEVSSALLQNAVIPP